MAVDYAAKFDDPDVPRGTVGQGNLTPDRFPGSYTFAAQTPFGGLPISVHYARATRSGSFKTANGLPLSATGNGNVDKTGSEIRFLLRTSGLWGADSCTKNPNKY